VALDPRLKLSRSWTTRPRRPRESEGAYNFVDEPTFEARAVAGGFLEHAEFLGHRYGTPVPDLDDGLDHLLEIDLQGVRQVKARLPDTVVIFLTPPSEAVQRERLRLRGDDEAAIERRLATGRDEVRQAAELADHQVVNLDLDRTVADVAAILAGHRRRAPASPGVDPVGGS
jgi:guanylate kinase